MTLICVGTAQAAPVIEGGARRTPSGQPVPRYVATRFSTVNARSGPGDDYRLVWVYRAQGLPLQVIAETEEWRRVCDPDGGVAWVHRRTVGDVRHVLRTSTSPLPLRSRPQEDARPTALLAGRALAALGRCDHGWCRLSVDHATGFVRAAEVWGAVDALQCAAPHPSAHRRGAPIGAG